MKTALWPISKGMGAMFSGFLLALVLALPNTGFADYKDDFDKAATSYQKCVDREIKANKPEGVKKCESNWNEAKAAMEKRARKDYEENECGKSQAFSGGSIKGESCKRALNTIKEVQQSNQLTSQVGTTSFAMTSQLAAMRSSGSQADAQKTTGRVMQGAALVKMLEASAQTYGVTKLSESATNAEDTHKKLVSLKNTIVKNCKEASDPDACAKKELTDKNYKIAGITDSDSADYGDVVKFVNEAAEQAAEQANAASSARTASGAGAAINSLVGLMAWKQAQMAMRNQQAMAKPPQTYFLNPNTGGSTPPSLPGALPDDFGAAPPSGTLLGLGKGSGITDRPSKPITGAGSVPFISKKATVSGGSSLGGSASGGKGPAKPTRKGARSYASSVGGYEAGSGLGGGGKTPAAAADQNNPFADALAKMFGPEGTNDPFQQQAAVDGRSLASQGEEGSEVYETDVTIFEQINTKYRQLRANGSI